MTGWTPLWQDIVTSSIWTMESKETRLLWITMLALKDRHGIVGAAIPGLAKMAGLTIEETEAGLKILSAPDKYSRSIQHEGRRIEKCPDGWRILNAEHYKAKIQEGYRKEYNRKAQAKHRKKTKWPTKAEAAYVKADGDGEHEKANEIVDGLLRKEEHE